MFPHTPFSLLGLLLPLLPTQVYHTVRVHIGERRLQIAISTYATHTHYVKNPKEGGCGVSSEPKPEALGGSAGVKKEREIVASSTPFSTYLSPVDRFSFRRTRGRAPHKRARRANALAGDVGSK